VSTLLPDRTTPELRHLQAKLGALIAYRQAAGVLDTFLPMPSSFTHNTTRNRLLCIGQAIEAELQDNIEYKRTVADPVATMAIGVDGAFVEAAPMKANASCNVFVPEMAQISGKLQFP
jgi:hypothetical protein